MSAGEKVKLAATTALAIALTPAAILVVYFDYDVGARNLPAALVRFEAWPWLSGSLLLTTLSSLVPFYLLWSSGANRSKFDNELVAYSFGVQWVPLLFLYPGTHALRVSTGSMAAFAMFLICVVQYLQARNVAAFAWRHTPWSSGP